LTPGGSSTVHIYTQTVQQYSTHVHTNCTQNTENGTYITIKRKNGKCGPFLVFESYTLAFALQLREKHGKTSVMVVEKCPDIPVAVVQYTFTHKQYSSTVHIYTQNSTQNTENGIYITIKRKKFGSTGRAPSLCVIPWHLLYN
jgi:hypothetical protein